MGSFQNLCHNGSIIPISILFEREAEASYSISIIIVSDIFTTTHQIIIDQSQAAASDFQLASFPILHDVCDCKTSNFAKVLFQP